LCGNLKSLSLLKMREKSQDGWQELIMIIKEKEILLDIMFLDKFQK